MFEGIWAARNEIMLLIIIIMVGLIKYDSLKISVQTDKLTSISAQAQANGAAYNQVVKTVDQKEKNDNARQSFISQANSSLASKADGSAAPVLVDALKLVRARSKSAASAQHP